MPDYKSVFEKREQEMRRREEEERRKREEKEHRRREVEEAHRREEEARHREEERKRQEVAWRFDLEIKQVLRGYGEVKLDGKNFRVEGPHFGYSDVSWSLYCSGYNGVTISLQFRRGLLSNRWKGLLWWNLEPTGFMVSGTYGGQHEANLSIADLVNALADSRPTVYSPSSSESSSSSSYCDMGFS